MKTLICNVFKRVTFSNKRPPQDEEENITGGHRTIAKSWNQSAKRFGANNDSRGQAFSRKMNNTNSPWHKIIDSRRFQTCGVFKRAAPKDEPEADATKQTNEQTNEEQTRKLTISN